MSLPLRAIDVHRSQLGPGDFRSLGRDLCRLFVFSGVVVALGCFARAASAPDASVEGQSASTGAIVQRLVENNRDRANRLPECTSKRHYHIEFHGFGRNMVADMNVDVRDHGSASKTFRITSESGSHVLLEHVLEKLIDNERDASQNKEQNGLTPLNYNFTLVGNAYEDGRSLFILQVEPKENRKLLYRGRIWVDARDYAVARIEAEPAKNPSFWIHSTQIHHVYAKVGDFWLPQRNVSESKTRFGGTATLTIDYGNYALAGVNAPQQTAVASNQASSDR